MHFQCVQCARRHSFPAARTGATGRVPCQCGATLVVEPPRAETHSFAAPELADADLLALGYLITVESSPRWFDAAHATLRAGIGVGRSEAGASDQASAANAPLLWPALGAALDPRLFVPPALLTFAVLAPPAVLPPLSGWSPASNVVALLAAVLGLALAFALGAVAVAVAMHEALVAGGVGSARAALASLVRGGRRGLAASATRDAAATALVAAFCVLGLAVLLTLGRLGPSAAVVSAVSGPLQAALAAGILAAGVMLAGTALAHAAEAPRADGVGRVLVALNVRRTLDGGRGLLRKPFGPALGAAVALAVALGALVTAAVLAWQRMAAVFGTPVAADLAIAAAGRLAGTVLLASTALGVLAAFVGIAGLLGGYALGTRAARAPDDRSPEIITGTLRSLQALVDSDVQPAPRPPLPRPPPTGGDD